MAQSGQFRRICVIRFWTIADFALCRLMSAFADKADIGSKEKTDALFSRHAGSGRKGGRAGGRSSAARSLRNSARDPRGSAKLIPWRKARPSPRSPNTLARQRRRNYDRQATVDKSRSIDDCEDSDGIKVRPLSSPRARGPDFNLVFPRYPSRGRGRLPPMIVAVRGTTASSMKLARPRHVRRTNIVPSEVLVPRSFTCSAKIASWFGASPARRSTIQIVDAPATVPGHFGERFSVADTLLIFLLPASDYLARKFTRLDASASAASGHIFSRLIATEQFALRDLADFRNSAIGPLPSLVARAVELYLFLGRHRTISLSIPRQR